MTRASMAAQPEPEPSSPEYETATVEQSEDAAMPLGLSRRKPGRKPVEVPTEEDDHAQD